MTHFSNQLKVYKNILFLIYLFLSLISQGHSLEKTKELGTMSSLRGQDLLTKQKIQIESKPLGLVIIFLSAKCPCSNSHIAEIKTLSKEFSQFQFVAVHSNKEEELSLAQNYFKSLDLSFPIIEDDNFSLADQFQAMKTPHAFVFNTKGELQFKGGVSDSRQFANSEIKYLRLALEDVAAQKKLRYPHARTLGCAITRD